MKALIVYWHPEPQSFNHALLVTAENALTSTGWEVATSDLWAMSFDPVSSRGNFLGCKDPQYFKPQIEEMHATEVAGFSPELDQEIRRCCR